MRALGAQSIAFPEANIAPGATSPDPGVVGVTVLSTVTDELLVWDGSGWRAAPGTGGGGGGGGSPDPLELLTDYSTTTPSSPATGVKMFARQLAGRRRPAFVGPSGLDTGLQALIGANKIGFWNAVGNNSTPHVMGLNNSVSGTATGRNVANTNRYTMMRRIGYQVGTGMVCGTRHSAPQFNRDAGFEYIARFGVAALPNSGTPSLLVGMVNVTTAVGEIGMGTAAGFGLRLGGGMWVIHSSGAGSGFPTQHATLPAASFPANTASIDMFEARFFCPPGGTSIGWAVTRIVGGSGEMASGSITTDLPASNVLLSPIIHGSAVTNSSGYGIDVVSQYIETDL